MVSILELRRSPGGRHGHACQDSFPGEFPWTEEPGRLQSMGLHKSRDKAEAIEQAHRHPFS